MLPFINRNEHKMIRCSVFVYLFTTSPSIFGVSLLLSDFERFCAADLCRPSAWLRAQGMDHWGHWTGFGSGRSLGLKRDTVEVAAVSEVRNILCRKSP